MNPRDEQRPLPNHQHVVRDNLQHAEDRQAVDREARVAEQLDHLHPVDEEELGPAQGLLVQRRALAGGLHCLPELL